MRKSVALLLCLVLYMLPLAANDNHPPHVSAYINTYYELAIREMHRSGIPASVTLAQGIHESSWGRGELSLNSNNHFGIKCKESWTGKSFYIEDDDYRNGVLIKSCFRVYNNVEDSYIDHTNFLVQNSRYHGLFEFSSKDYENWANGLQGAGYATDKKYAKKLIATIEKYGLNKYDYVEEVEEPQILVAPGFNVPTQVVEPSEELALNQTLPSTKIDVPSMDEEEGDDEYEDDEVAETIVAQEEVIPVKVYNLEASTAYDHEVPAAVSIEGYQRNSNEVKIVAPVVIEENTKSVKKQMAKKKKVKPAPSYVLRKKGFTAQKADNDSRVSNDNSGKLFQLRAKPRLSNKLR